MEKLTIAVIAGTVRPGRKSIGPAKLVYEVGKTKPELEMIFVDPVDFPFTGDGNNDELRIPAYTRITEQADGFFIVTPEYNHGYPGSLKRMLDSEYANYTHKPVALAGVSDGPWGGVRAIEHLVPSLRKMGMVLLQRDVQFPNVLETFNEQGELVDQKYLERVNKIYNELMWMTRALKTARQQTANG